MPNGKYGGVGGKGAKDNLSLPDLPDRRNVSYRQQKPRKKLFYDRHDFRKLGDRCVITFVLSPNPSPMSVCRSAAAAAAALNRCEKV